MTRTKVICARATIILATLPMLVVAYEYGPNPGYTGAPGDNPTACISSGCHVGTVNSGPGNVKIILPSGNTGTYVPGQAMQILVQITDATKVAYGFQLTARMGSGNNSQSGDFTTTDANTQVLCADTSVKANGKLCPTSITVPIEYIEHTATGYEASIKATPKGSYTYSFNWTPPAAGSGTVTMYVAANSGIGDPPEVTPTDVYTSKITLTPDPSLLTISHIADGGGWRSTIILVNNDTVPALYTVSFWRDTGISYTPPLASGATNGSIPVGGSTIIQTADTSSVLGEGWAQVSSNQAVGGTAVFRYDPWSQEAAVPLLANGALKLEIPYQVANGLTLGVALANPSASQTANITEVIRDLNGNQLASRTFTLAALNHSSFLPTFPGSISGGGVVEYDSDVNIYGLGIRSAPEGTGLAFTSLDAVPLEPASTERISHIADGGGWRSTIILVNTATVPAVYTVNFWSDSGASYVPPLSSGAASGSIPVGGTTIIATADTASTLSEGWATVTSAQTLGGTAVFRYDPWSQEAAVPLLPSGGVHLEIPYQVGNNLTLGIALANPNATQTANITEVIRDANGNQLSARTFTLAALDHTAFIPTYPANNTEGGVAEYDSDQTIYGLGIRSAPEGTGLAFTSVRAVYR